MLNRANVHLLAAAALLATTACVVDDAGPAVDDVELGSTESPSYILTSSAWSMSNGVASVGVCWTTGGFATEKAWVRQVIESRYEGQPFFHVDLVGWGDCPTIPGGIPVYGGIKIRIRDSSDAPNVTSLGDGLVDPFARMNLDFKFGHWSTDCASDADGKRRRCIEQIAMHEFGHALGLAHEQNRDDRPDSCTDSPQGTDGDVYVGQFDQGSLMAYCNPAWNNGGQLSGGDVAGLARLYGGGGDVFVARNAGGAFATPRSRNDAFGFGDEIQLTGDFNRDRRADLVTFTRGGTGDVYVALSNGVSFDGVGVKWHDSFAFSDEVPLVGDFDGLNGDDVATLTRGSSGGVYVALSNGTNAFNGDGWQWASGLCLGDSLCKAGDVNGDGKDDLIIFSRGSTGNVWVALSTGSSFVGAGKWASGFAVGGNLAEVGDVDGDGDDDIVSFTRGDDANVWVALSNRSSFVGAGKWHDFVVSGSALPALADVNNDRRADVVSFTRGTEGNVWVATSTGSSFYASDGGLWTTGACLQDDTCLVGDVDADGQNGGKRADVIAIKRR